MMAICVRCTVTEGLMDPCSARAMIVWDLRSILYMQMAFPLECQATSGHDIGRLLNTSHVVEILN